MFNCIIHFLLRLNPKEMTADETLTKLGLDSSLVIQWNGRSQRVRRPPPLTYWEEFVATDSWYIRELTADVPEDEWEAAVKDEDWDEEMIEVGGEEDEEAESEEDCAYSEESGEEEESESDLNGEEEKIEKARNTKRKSIRAKLRRGESLPSSSSSSSSNSSSSDSDSDYESDNNNNNNNNNDSKNNATNSKSNDVIEDEDQTPMLLVGLQTMQEKGRGGRVQRTKIELAPPRVTSYKLRVGDRLFFVADDIEEVNNKMTQLLQWYTYQTNNASAETKTASETKENSNASASIQSSSSIIQSTGSLRKSFERFDSRGVKKQDAILHEMDASSYQNHGARSSTDSDTDSDELTEEQLLNRRHANDPNTALLDFDVLHQRQKGSKNHLFHNSYVLRSNTGTFEICCFSSFEKSIFIVSSIHSL